MLGPRPVQRTFRNDLSGRDSFGLKVGHFIALCEASPAQSFALRVLFDDDFTIGLGDLLLNDGLVEVGLLIGLLSLVHSKYISHPTH